MLHPNILINSIAVIYFVLTTLVLIECGSNGNKKPSVALKPNSEPNATSGGIVVGTPLVCSMETAAGVASVKEQFKPTKKVPPEVVETQGNVPKKDINVLVPRIIKLDVKEELLAEGKLVLKQKNLYPTMSDVLSDWDSEKESIPKTFLTLKKLKLKRIT
uniref:Uncharacterized protein n=1 Tax=Rhabditophanes sp. KR3021 TaxID=114890 RepID=A0AC35U941_9BILA